MDRRDLHKENQAGASGLIPTPSRVGYQPDAIVVDIERVKEKSRSTTAAKLALLGAEFRELPSGVCLVTCGGVQRRFWDHGAVREFLEAIEGRA